MSNEEKERFSRIPIKADIIVTMCFSLTVYLFYCVIDSGHHGIVGNFITTNLNKLFFIKYLICLLPIEIGIQYYKYFLHKYFYQKLYFVLRLPLIFLIFRYIYKVFKIIFPRVPYSELENVRKKRGDI